MTTPKGKKVSEARKTFKERAEYLSFIDPTRREIYMTIAQFFGEDSIPATPVLPSKPNKKK